MSKRYTKATLGGRIWHALKAAGVTKELVMRETGKSRESVNRWIRGNVTPRDEDISVIESLTGISRRWIVTGEGEMSVSHERVTGKAPQSQGIKEPGVVIQKKSEESGSSFILRLSEIIEPLIKQRLMEVTSLRGSLDFREGLSFSFPIEHEGEDFEVRISADVKKLPVIDRREIKIISPSDEDDEQKESSSS